MSDFEGLDLDIDSVEKQFNRAAEYLQTIAGDLDQGTLLDVYGLYKQGTVGDCNIQKPGMFAMQAKAKWNAWNSRKSLTKDEAMAMYIELIAKINPNWDDGSPTKSKSKPKSQQWVSVSQHQISDGTDDKPIADSDKTAFDHVKEGQVDRLLYFLEKSLGKYDIDQLDESGLGLIHWAADRGNVDVLNALLSNGCNVNLQDTDGQTALHYASSVGHVDCVEQLLKNGGDRTILDSNSESCLDVANDPVIVNLLQ